jgi:argininosuccinate lyase
MRNIKKEEFLMLHPSFLIFHGKTWGGRFAQETHALVEELTASIQYDRKLYVWDILGSQAHARMLMTCGVLTPEELDAILCGLNEVRQEIDEGRLEFSNRLEDIHTHVENRLIEKIGEPGRKLHTARSRNDQVATDFRLYLRHELDQVHVLLHKFECTLIALAEQYADAVFPDIHIYNEPNPLFSDIIFWHITRC